MKHDLESRPFTAGYIRMTSRESVLPRIIIDFLTPLKLDTDRKPQPITRLSCHADRVAENNVHTANTNIDLWLALGPA